VKAPTPEPAGDSLPPEQHPRQIQIDRRARELGKDQPDLSWARQSPERHEREETPPVGQEHERRRTRPRPSTHKINDRVVIPNTLKEVLEGVTVQHVAMENWSRKRLVLVGSGQTLERVSC
jgi:hypothetical protein